MEWEREPEAKREGREVGKRIKIALYSAILFTLLANRYSGKILNNIAGLFTNGGGNELIDDLGCYNLKGLVLGAFIVFFITIFFIFRSS